MALPHGRPLTVYAPLGVFLFVLLFPFYWMGITTFKPNEELLSREGNPFWVASPTLAHINKLLFETAYPDWLWNTMLVAVVSTFLAIVCSVLAAYAIERGAVLTAHAAARLGTLDELRRLIAANP